MCVQFTSCVYGVYDLVRFCIALKYSGFYPLTLYCILRENDQIHLQNLAEFAERLLKSDHSGALCITRLSGHMVFFFFAEGQMFWITGKCNSRSYNSHLFVRIIAKFDKLNFKQKTFGFMMISGGKEVNLLKFA